MTAPERLGLLTEIPVGEDWKFVLFPPTPLVTEQGFQVRFPGDWKHLDPHRGRGLNPPLSHPKGEPHPMRWITVNGPAPPYQDGAQPTGEGRHLAMVFRLFEAYDQPGGKARTEVGGTCFWEVAAASHFDVIVEDLRLIYAGAVDETPWPPPQLTARNEAEPPATAAPEPTLEELIAHHGLSGIREAVVRLWDKGLTASEIAGRLDRTAKTIENLKSEIRTKYDRALVPYR